MEAAISGRNSFNGYPSSARSIALTLYSTSIQFEEGRARTSELFTLRLIHMLPHHKTGCHCYLHRKNERKGYIAGDVMTSNNTSVHGLDQLIPLLHD